MTLQDKRLLEMVSLMQLCGATDLLAQTEGLFDNHGFGGSAAKKFDRTKHGSTEKGTALVQKGIGRIKDAATKLLRGRGQHDQVSGLHKALDHVSNALGTSGFDADHGVHDDRPSTNKKASFGGQLAGGLAKLAKSAVGGAPKSALKTAGKMIRPNGPKPPVAAGSEPKVPSNKLAMRPKIKAPPQNKPPAAKPPM